jgi:hypothetical protein
MAFDPLDNALESFSAPIEAVISALGQGIAEAQRALDLNSVQMQETIDSDPVLSQYGLQATWYQFPKVDLQLTMSLTVAEDDTTSQNAPSSPAAVRALSPKLSSASFKAIRLVAQPVSASFQSHFNYSGQAASQIKLSIVPVPAPRPGDQVTLPPSMQTADVQKAALTSPAKFLTLKDSQGNLSPAPTDSQNPPNALRFDLNFNASSRTWYVLQYAPANKAVVPVVVAVDDASKAVRIIST